MKSKPKLSFFLYAIILESNSFVDINHWLFLFTWFLLLNNFKIIVEDLRFLDIKNLATLLGFVFFEVLNIALKI